MKVCTKCKQEKPLSEFKDPYWCIECRREYHRAHNQTPARREYNKQIYQRLKREGYFKKYYQRPDVRARRAAQMRQYTNDPKHRVKHLARWITNRAKVSGKIEAQPCAQCGKNPTHAHHLDYNKPLLIVWLCRECHSQLHREIETKHGKEA